MRPITLRSLGFALALALGLTASACGTKTTKPPANPEPATATPPANALPGTPEATPPTLQRTPAPATPAYKPGDPDSGGERR